LQSHHDLSPTGATERNNEQHLAQEKRAGFPAPAVSAFSYGKQSLKTTDAAHADQTLSPISDKERAKRDPAALTEKGYRCISGWCVWAEECGSEGSGERGG